MSRLVHFWHTYPAPEDAARREREAKESWDFWYESDENGVLGYAIPLRNLPRRFHDDSNGRDYAFVKDVFDEAVNAFPDHQEFVFTNGDVSVVSDASTYIRAGMGTHRCGFSFRVDFGRDAMPKADLTMRGLGARIDGHWYPGADMFWFTRDWWFEHKDDLPDGVLGGEGWDFCMKHAMHESGFPEAVHWLIWHEAHDNHWKQTLETSPLQLYCRRVCREWAQRHGYHDKIREKGYLFA